MKRIHYLYLVLGVCVFSLAGCADKLPFMIGRSGGIEFFPSYTPKDRDMACTSIITFNPKAAFDDYPKDEPILWTFGVNFDVLSSPEGNPLGCLRLYQRNEDKQEFESIDAGGILVDACEIVKSSSPVLIASGAATFTGDGHIQCKMNLAEWVKNLALELSSASEIREKLKFFSERQIHVYTNFTMAAAVSTADPAGSKPARPLMNYTPDYGAVIDFSVQIVNHQAVTAPVEKCEEKDGRPPGYPLNKMGIWWYDLRDGKDKDRSPYLQYPASDDLVSGSPAATINCTVPPEIAPSAPIQFVIGSATLSMGYNSSDESLFFGSMDGILIDPVDSKPPTAPSH